MNKPKVIAEIGCNHKGDINIAKEMIMTAATYCKADIVKFQKDAIENCLHLKNIMLHIQIHKTRMEKHTVNTGNFWNSIWSSIANFNHGAMNTE